MNIVVLEPLGVKANILQTLAQPLTARGHQITFYDTRANTVQEQISRAQGADVLIIANQPLGKEVLQACPRLKFISVAFTGVDHVDTAYAKEHHIAVCNAAGYSTHAAAEHPSCAIFRPPTKPCGQGKTKPAYWGGNYTAKPLAWWVRGPSAAIRRT